MRWPSWTPTGVCFSPTPMLDTLPAEQTATCFVDDSLPSTHPYRVVVTQAVGTQQTSGPLTAAVPAHPTDEGDATELEVTAHAFRDLHDEFEGVILVSRRGIDWVRSVQSQLEASRQLAELGGLLAGVGHEVKNPLNAMAIHLELLRQKLGETPPGIPAVNPQGSVLGLHPSDGVEAGAEEAASASTGPVRTTADVLQHVTVLGNEVRRLDDVIQGFLRFIKQDDLVQAPVNIRDLIDGVVALIKPTAEGTGVTLDHRYPSPAPVAMGDQALLRQALLNLAINAVQAMPNGGRLRFEVAEETRWIQLDVEDNGPGMTPDVLKRAFELYYTTKADGSGIGLSMVFRIMQLHGGTIGIESKFGSGTRVRIRLPGAEHTGLQTTGTNTTRLETV
jgi:signal transduction histidine kinase